MKITYELFTRAYKQATFHRYKKLRSKNINLLCQRAYATSYVQRALCSNNDSACSHVPDTDLPTTADVVIIGGGSIGCQTLYHLVKLGITNSLLLERNKLTSGTTWHTAGLVWRLRPNDTVTSLLNVIVEQIRELEETSDISSDTSHSHFGWVNNGGLFIANNRTRLDEYRRLKTLGDAMGIQSHILSAQESLELNPLLRVDDIEGCLYSPGDGSVDPTALCSTLEKLSKRGGAKVFEHCPVLGITTEMNDGIRRVSGVTTPRGQIKTGVVVNAAGAWGGHISAMVNVHLPLVPMRHAYVVTDTIDGVGTTPNVRDHDASVYLRVQGDSLCIGGYESNPIIIDALEQDVAFGLYDLNWDVFACHLEGAMNRMPILKQVGIKSTVCGPESFTPDHNPLMGEDCTIRGLFHNCGYNSSGMMLGAGCGWQMAEWIDKGRPSLDLSSFDIRRFNRKSMTNKQWVQARSHEAYAKNYSIVFPHDEPLNGRNERKDILYDVLLDKGCVYQERQGWERPGWFSGHPTIAPPTTNLEINAVKNDNVYKQLLEQDYTFQFPKHFQQIANECLACRNAAVLFNMSYFAKLYLVGKQAQQAADWIFSNDMQRKTSNVVYTCILNSRGGIESDLTVTIIDTGGMNDVEFDEPITPGRMFYIAVGGGFENHVQSYITNILENESFNAQLINTTETMAMLSLQGPNSRSILSCLTNTRLENNYFPFGSSQVIRVAGHPVRALRVSFVGELGWELHMHNTHALEIYNAIKKAGRAYGLVDAGYRAMDSLSAEKGYKHWHSEIRIDDTPIQARMLYTCKLRSQTDFLGRQALLAEQERDRLRLEPRRRLVCFTTASPYPLWGLERLLCDNQTAGYVRRAEVCHYLGCTIVYGYIWLRGAETLRGAAARQWDVDVMGVTVPLAMHLRGPFDPDSCRMQGDYR